MNQPASWDQFRARVHPDELSEPEPSSSKL